MVLIECFFRFTGNIPLSRTCLRPRSSWTLPRRGERQRREQYFLSLARSIGKKSRPAVRHGRLSMEPASNEQIRLSENKHRRRPNHFGQCLQLARLKRALIDAGEFPSPACLLGDALAPVADGRVLRFRAFPYTPLGLDDPVHLTLGGPLHDDPVRMIETNRTARFEVVHAGNGVPDSPCSVVARLAKRRTSEAF